ncbi:hypothetical protein CJ260_00705 [Megasphaera sp. ASD88]|uniref:dUTP diphosphatase n=1 Tax=Megasphaera sp. ASD88 TaxID=2027407 RepID=UPI000BAB670C|nr:dUTP diphosphatase [Megasphaera sp. ASD88]PAV39991.1 hypothetical protein CJ260_00705 [Megasphaera sp. ASD88]
MAVARKTETTNETEPIEVKVKLLRDGAQMPVKKDGDAAFDFFAAEDIRISPRCAGVPVPTGVAIEMPKGYYMELFMRSSYGAKKQLRLSNCVGVIDNSYRGEIKGLFDNHSVETDFIRKGERFMQGIIKKETPANLVLVDKLSETDRGDGGFGSTGK